MEYRCVATSVEGFVQQLAVSYITHGYWFYVVGEIPEGKEPAAVDAKLIERYGIAISKWARCRRKKQGLANMQYLRHERFFVLLATKGRHEFFERERAVIRDVRRLSIKFAGYSIGCRNGRDGRWHAAVCIDAKCYLEMKAGLMSADWHVPKETMVAKLRGVGIGPYAPIRRQILTIARAKNRARKAASASAASVAALQLRRRVVQPFE